MKNKETLLLSIFFGAIWVLAAGFFWWRMAFDGASPLLITDTGLFGIQELKVDLVAMGVVLLSGVVFLRTSMIQDVSPRILVSLVLSAVGLLFCSTANQFWYFSIGLLFFILSQAVSSQQSKNRNSFSLVFISVLGTGLEPYYSSAPQWFLGIFFSFFIIVAFKFFPNTIKIDNDLIDFKSVRAWLLHEVPAMGAAIFFIKKAPLFLQEQDALTLKILLSFLSIVTLIRSYALKGSVQRSQFFLATLGLLVVYGLGARLSTEWMPSAIVAFVALFVATQSGFGSYLSARWASLSLFLILCSPFSVFGHGIIASTASEEFIMNIWICVLPLVFFGLGLGGLFALNLLSPEEGNTKATGLVSGFFLFLLSIQFLWKGVWISEADITAISEAGAWAPISIIFILSVTTLTTHRAIERIFSEFSQKLGFQDQVWLSGVGILSDKTLSIVTEFEKRVFQTGLGKILKTSLDVTSRGVVMGEELLFLKTANLTKRTVLRATHWIKSSQTTDAQYYLIFGIGTVVLVLLHFLLNASL
ncbi:MAG: hypothetical protein KA715_01930 [Xanthomonadaceae bacterium]|nr:hypothetical protein [Xanthomonadaceae bacterium]